jgi:hypothetical protein
MVLSYDDDTLFTLRGRRKRLNQEATDAEARLELALSDIACSDCSRETYLHEKQSEGGRAGAGVIAYRTRDK